MKNEEAFVMQSPYPLIPTNIPGAFASPALPDDLDLNTASRSELVRHGLLLRRPSPGEHPVLIANWEQFVSPRWHAKDRIMPLLEPQHGKTHLLRGLKKANTGFTSNNWGGGEYQGQWTYVQGRWNIPTVSKPPEPQGQEGGWNSSSWVGLDGWNSNDVLQAGIQQRVNGNGQAFYVAWYEWFAPAQPNSPGYIWQTNITNFPVSPGNIVFCLVKYINNKTAGYILFNNETTGKHFTITLAPPPGAAFSGNSMEWIMEAPDGGEPHAALPTFTSVLFSNAFGGNNNALSLVPIIGHAQDGDFLNINNGNQTLTSVSLDPDAVLIKFVG